jgi:transketolase
MAVQTRGLAEVALRVRGHVLDMAAGPAGAHVGGSLSAADILTVLYGRILTLDPQDLDAPGRDHFILSKGHASAALYATLAEHGFLPVAELATYARAGSRLAGHPRADLPGVEFPTGSLGHGLGLGVGVALATRHDGLPGRVFVLHGDGELQEGSVWEAALVAGRLGLDNLVAVVDHNGLQINGPTGDGDDAQQLADRWSAFGWSVAVVDGHDLDALTATFSAAPFAPGRPSAVIARTVKGRGVRFLEGKASSHYATLSAQAHDRARLQLRRTASAPRPEPEVVR